ncbi:hypothetical protein [Actinomadura mexicana]|uniref:Peptidase family M1 n=1 Tax=Actinomadura mexicana TaxID=134959 RepID=A0A238WQI4_9ACTN|nr:hypothetical protein [Actinomadura mexicana]SNR48668.1 Peptidase family M1 [Actinomadura mexicana]
MGEPNGASTWFPANDHPRDKALVTLETTVPHGLKAIGNGRLVRQWSAHGKDTFLWREDRPMATYLVTKSIGRFSVSATTTPKGVPQLDAVDPDVYFRGAMTLQALRHKIGDGPFLRLVRTWVSDKRYANGSTGEFEALAERIHGQNLDAFFTAWLHSPSKPTTW